MIKKISALLLLITPLIQAEVVGITAFDAPHDSRIILWHDMHDANPNLPIPAGFRKTNTSQKEALLSLFSTCNTDNLPVHFFIEMNETIQSSFLNQSKALTYTDFGTTFYPIWTAFSHNMQDGVISFESFDKRTTKDDQNDCFFEQIAFQCLAIASSQNIDAIQVARNTIASAKNLKTWTSELLGFTVAEYETFLTQKKSDVAIIAQEIACTYGIDQELLQNHYFEVADSLLASIAEAIKKGLITKEDHYLTFRTALTIMYYPGRFASLLNNGKISNLILKEHAHSTDIPLLDSVLKQIETHRRIIVHAGALHCNFLHKILKKYPNLFSEIILNEARMYTGIGGSLLQKIPDTTKGWVLAHLPSIVSWSSFDVDLANISYIQKKQMNWATALDPKTVLNTTKKLLI